ncbi:START domain [Trypanosoma vivax]|uniref:START domain-containing protein 10 n=1 Tax=Trypanosoma vivax (strain Y486) TaxID=1055687 RepID=G0TSX3_TRYVY|nr:hypothetical protein TRVL_07486 [Trypanosoma vivax]KAH8605727.1 START domain [Trypanosoma vivax]CCC47052.1 conserved hypothetical protein [Trypanosoma vivax Y486]
MPEKDVYAVSAGAKYRLQVLRDFRKFREFALSDNGWTRELSSTHIVVDTQSQGCDGCNKLKVVRVRREMPQVSCEDLYDTLHDSTYRKTWDDNMIEGYNIAVLNRHNDIGYYAVKLPWPMKNRDFCNMRSWMEFTNGEYIIFNHSVPHKDCPPNKSFVRAKSILTGYLIRPLGSGGCVLNYITHSDPCGSIPHSIINMVVTRVVPSVMSQLQKCSLNYRVFFEKTYKVSRAELPWRTPKMNWDSANNFPEDDIDTEKGEGEVDGR